MATIRQSHRSSVWKSSISDSSHSHDKWSLRSFTINPIMFDHVFFWIYHMVFSLVISYSCWQWPFTVKFPIRHGGYFHSYVSFHRAGMLSAFHFITSFWSFPSYRSIDLLQGITMILMSRIGSSTRIPKCLQFGLLTNYWWLKWQWVGKHILVICLCVCAPCMND